MSAGSGSDMSAHPGSHRVYHSGHRGRRGGCESLSVRSCLVSGDILLGFGCCNFRSNRSELENHD